MPKNYSPEADDQMPEKKSSQNRLLLLLLLLVLLFAYLYFFTGLIKPREEQVAQAPAPEAAPTDVVKQPLPPRTEGGAQPEPADGKPAADAKGAQAPAQPETAAKPAAPAAPAAAPEGAKAGKPAAAPEGAKAGKPAAARPEAKPAKPAAPQTAQKPAAPEAKPAAKPAAAAKATAKPAAPAADAKQAKAKTAPAKDAKSAAAAKDAKTAAAAKDAKTAAAAKDAKTAAAAAQKGAAGGNGKAVAAKAAPAAAAGAYVLEINDDLPEAEIKSVSAKLKQAGVAPVVTARSQKGEPVHRLYLADFGNRQEALEELERLKLAAPNAFMLKENGRYAVYGGSFMRESRAAVEQNRLYEKGVQLMIKTGTATVPVVKLRAGSFANAAKAEQAAQSLKQKGITAKVVKVAK